ncbi:Gfo/Idh/MocA family protein [Christiangramia forsetii]|uniref:Protein containing oxidoreductase domain n=2 Tax=Christiangramia forsetii TaxID=411153 RepID=A0M2E3_CHRFK|nr:Gfo/Idh/MocA family oxidoreductase [Christiangramia forsetii]GGG39358.1 dehydrogenase [Christiangramia forsetii]CAL66788.1 protein containing oxidoreductase domain [Christiangramia forsetii KT0803]
MKKIKWGIIGLGKIANKFAEDLKSVSNAELYAVASREIEKANDFSKVHNSEMAYGSYEELMNDENVDVIYIATPHVFHHQLTLKCINHGKAVLCEKPFAMNLQEAEEMITLSRQKKVFLMEALWTRFLPHFQYVRERINSGEFGKVKSVKADFGFPAEFDKNKRLFNKSLGGGSLLDIGIYPVFLAYSILGKPENIKASAEFTETGVDSACNMKFNYADGVEADLFSTFQEKTPTTAEILLEKGKIILNSRFHEPTTITVISEGKEVIKDFGVHTTGYNFEAAHVTEMYQKGRIESDIWSHTQTTDLMTLLDSIREEIGLKY